MAERDDLHYEGLFDKSHQKNQASYYNAYKQPVITQHSPVGNPVQISIMSGLAVTGLTYYVGRFSGLASIGMGVVVGGFLILRQLN
jgi:hypothetical protein